MKKVRAFGNSSGITLLNENLSTVAKGSTVRISNLFNSGWQNGDIRRCYLSDITSESVTGPELVTNGTFDTDTTGWGVSTGVGTATIAAVSGELELTNAATAFGGAGQNITAVAGKTYKLEFTIRRGTASSVSFYYGIDYNTGSSANTTSTTPVSFVRYYTATTNRIRISLVNQSDTIGHTGYLDNISVKEVVADRSYKRQGASIYGTLTKSAVATNAQLVAYSGFSAANYLQEPYSADLDFGTGEWSASAWVNIPTTLPVENFPVVGAEALLNNTLNDSTNWQAPTNGTISGNALNFSGTTTANQTFIGTTTGFDANKAFLVTLEVFNWTSGTVTLLLSNGLGSQVNLGSGNGVKSAIVSTTSINSLYVRALEVGATYSVRNISVKEVGPAMMADRAHSSGANLNLGITGTGKLTSTAYDGTTTRTVTTTSAYNTATWLKAEAVYKTDGSLAILVNGQEVAVTRGNPLLTLNNSNAVLTIGNSYALDAPFPGSITLLKLSATAPTYDQAAWMYAQEKQLFRDGAQCCLPDSGNIVDLTYDDVTDKWIAVSASNKSSWTGLVRTNVTAVPAGSYTKVVATSGVELNNRDLGTNLDGYVDVTIPAYGLREELLKDGEDSGKLARIQVPLDYVGGFTATTVNGNTAITSVAGLSYPSQTTIIGATVTGSGIPASTTVVGISGTTIYLSKAATASASGVQISFVDFVLPLGMEAKEVISAGAIKTEGATKDFTRLYDGFRETIRFGTAPGYTAAVQIIAIRSQA